ncbi:MAG: flagellar assembly protein FliW [Bryobacteraceae bacterium]|jgi:flagellar assembly factor FliW
MTRIETKHFGTIPADAGLVIEFPMGLPAFEWEHQFLAIEHPRTAPLVLLQSMSTSGLCFLALPVSRVDPGYQLQMSVEDLDVLGLAESSDAAGVGDMAVLALVVIGADGQVSANLMSPVVVNRENRRAVQAVRWDGAYSHNHPVAQLAGVTGGQEQPCS